MAQIPHVSDVKKRYIPLANSRERDWQGTKINERLFGFIPVLNENPKSLTTEEIEHFNNNGYTKPIKIFNEEEATQNRIYFDNVMKSVEEDGTNRDSYSINGFHVKCQRQYDIIMNKKILDKVEDLLGPNYFCWGSHFFCKLANESDHGFVPFHQDATYWPFDHNRTVTVWLAIDDADEENSAMNFIKGSHKTVYNYKKTEETNAVLLQEVLLDENEHDDDSYYYVNSMKAGECSIHADLLIHGSKPNISNRRRCGYTIRYTQSDCIPLNPSWARSSIHCRGFTNSKWWVNINRPKGEDFSPLVEEDFVNAIKVESRL